MRPLKNAALQIRRGKFCSVVSLQGILRLINSGLATEGRREGAKVFELPSAGAGGNALDIFTDK